MTHVEIYTKGWCPFCARAKSHLDAKGVVYEEIDVDTQPSRELEMRERAGRTSVPQIFINNHHVGGSDDLVTADRNGQLDAWLASNAEGVVA